MEAVIKQTVAEEQQVTKPEAARPIDINTHRARRKQPAAAQGAGSGAEGPADFAAVEAVNEAAQGEAVEGTAAQQPGVGLQAACLQSHLREKLSIVEKAVARRTTMPVLNCVLLEGVDGRLRLRTTDLDVGLTVYLPAQLGAAGDICLRAQQLLGIVKDLPDAKFVMKVDNPRNEAAVECGQFAATLKGLSADEFPHLPQAADWPLAATLPAAELLAALGQTEPAAAADDIRPILGTVNFSFHQDSLVLIAADGFLLNLRSAALEGIGAAAQDKGGQPRQVNIPASALARLAAVLPAEGKVDIHIAPNGGQVIFRHEEVELVCRTLDGLYPNIKAIMREQHTTEAVLDTAELRRGLRLAGACADSSGRITLSLNPDSQDGLHFGVVELAAKDYAVGDGRYSIETHVEGLALTAAVNFNMLLKELNLITTPKVRVAFRQAQEPIMVLEEAGGDVRMAVMPMRLDQPKAPAAKPTAEARPEAESGVATDEGNTAAASAADEQTNDMGAAAEAPPQADQPSGDEWTGDTSAE